MYVLERHCVCKRDSMFAYMCVTQRGRGIIIMSIIRGIIIGVEWEEWPLDLCKGCILLTFHTDSLFFEQFTRTMMSIYSNILKHQCKEHYWFEKG